MAWVTATELLEKLNGAGFTSKTGRIIFDFDSLPVQVRAKSAVGDLFQEWLGSWMERSDINFRTNPNSQDFPDYYLNETSNTIDLLEIKVFDHSASANFDVANFDTYTRSLLYMPHKVNADYLIFSYQLQNGVFSIKNIWLKKIWEITGPMEGRPVRLQVKQSVFVNIRPVQWYSSRAKFKAFGTRDIFLEALHNAIKKNPKTTSWDKDSWLEKVSRSLS